MSTQTLTLKREESPVTNTPKSIQAKTPQEAPQQPKKKNKADVHAKKKTTPYRPYSAALDTIQRARSQAANDWHQGSYDY
ncbi:hypothetical protein AB6E88_18570 [Providencia hangzhouensis]